MILFYVLSTLCRLFKTRKYFLDFKNFFFFFGANNDFSDPNLTNEPRAEGRKDGLIPFQRVFCVSEYDEPERNWNSALSLSILSHYPLEHLYIKAYSTWYSQAVTHLDTDQC